MTNEEAAAIWERFDAEVGDDLLRAVSGAFAFIACADAELADEEVERFLALVREQPSFAALDSHGLEARFRELASAFAADFADGEQRATEAVARVKDDPTSRELVLRAAQIAVVADSRLKAVEEAALGRICGALGVDPSDF
jgi:tellurite resistance protein